MGHVYLTRHGQTVWNVEKKICGATDVELTDLGRQQAKELGEMLCRRQQELQIDEILYSPLVRAAETANYISKATGIPCREEPRLKEMSFGKFEGMKKGSEEFQAAKEHFFDHYINGEPVARFCQRVYNLLDEIRVESDRKTYLLVAHTGVARVVNSYFYDMENAEFARFALKNCEVREYIFNEDLH